MSGDKLQASAESGSLLGGLIPSTALPPPSPRLPQSPKTVRIATRWAQRNSGTAGCPAMQRWSAWTFAITTSNKLTAAYSSSSELLLVKEEGRSLKASSSGLSSLSATHLVPFFSKAVSGKVGEEVEGRLTFKHHHPLGPSSQGCMSKYSESSSSLLKVACHGTAGMPPLVHGHAGAPLELQVGLPANYLRDILGLFFIHSEII